MAAILFGIRIPRKKIKSYERAQSSITSTDFSSDNSLFAYSVCYDWSKGIKKRNNINKICFHVVKNDDIKK